MPDEKKARLEALRAEHKQLSDARAAAEAASADDRELAKLEQGLKDKKAIMSAEQALGPQGTHCACIDTPRGVIIVKRAALPAFRMFQEIAAPKVSQIEELVNGCRFYPDVAMWDEIHDELPGLLMVCAAAIARLAGATADDAAKK